MGNTVHCHCLFFCTIHFASTTPICQEFAPLYQCGKETTTTLHWPTHECPYQQLVVKSVRSSHTGRGHVRILMMRQYAQALIYCRHDHLLAPKDKLLRNTWIQPAPVRKVTQCHKEARLLNQDEGSDRQTNQMLNLISPNCYYAAPSRQIQSVLQQLKIELERRWTKKTWEWFYL